MFSESNGNLLQLLALSMEVVGISLAAIELRWPEIASGIVKYHGGGSGAKGDAWLTMTLRQFYRWEQTGVGAPTKSLTGFTIFWWLCPTVYFTFEYLTSSLTMNSALVFDLVVLFSIPLVIIALTPLMIFLAARLGRFVASFSRDRNVGNLGLVIALAGLILELYQVVTVAISDQPSIFAAAFPLQILVATVGAILLIFTIYVVSVVIKVSRLKEKTTD
jgi:hypothetical protein